MGNITYKIELNQRIGVKYLLSMNQMAILEHIRTALEWAEPLRHEGKTYSKLYTQKIIDDLPSMGISSKGAIRDNIKILIEKGLVDRYIHNNNTPYFRCSDEYLEDTRGSYMPNTSLNDLVALADGVEASEDAPTNVTIINKLLYSVLSAIKKEENYSFSSKTKEEFNSLFTRNKKKTDLGGFTAEMLIDVWNGQEVKGWKNVNTSNPNSANIREIKVLWTKMQSEYTLDEFNIGLGEYIKEISERNQDTNYASHRFNLYQFIKQSNGFVKFLHLG